MKVPIQKRDAKIPLRLTISAIHFAMVIEFKPITATSPNNHFSSKEFCKYNKTIQTFLKDRLKADYIGLWRLRLMQQITRALKGLLKNFPVVDEGQGDKNHSAMVE